MSVEIIAEIGVNHNRDLDIAFRLIDVAKKAGADTAKFQASLPEEEVSAHHAPDHLAMIRELIPDFDFLEKCKARCEEVGIRFLCTPAEKESFQRLLDIGVTRIKIGSDNLNNDPFLYFVAETDIPVILSTGMSTMDEIRHAVAVFAQGYPLTLLHCGSAYPLPSGEANLKAIPTIHHLTGLPVGWSDHTTGMDLAPVAVGLGAVMIEKHLTLNYNMKGPDHRASLMPMGFETMVTAIRRTESALGHGRKEVVQAEAGNRFMMRKSIVASAPIKNGEPFTVDNLAVKRPGTGMEPGEFYRLLGTVAQRDYEKDQQI